MKKQFFICAAIMVIYIAAIVGALLWNHATIGYQLIDTPEPRQINKIDLNTATADQLQLIPGVGPSLSQKIVEYRTVNGPFAKVEDVQCVDGVGVRMLSRFLTYTTVGE